MDPSTVPLDGVRFRMESSTASAVDPAAPTRFVYHEADGVVWGEYAGDTVRTGRFVGRRAGDRIDIAFAHAPVTGGDVVTGESSSRIETDAAGAVRLIEDFAVEGVAHRSVCVVER